MTKLLTADAIRAHLELTKIADAPEDSVSPPALSKAKPLGAPIEPAAPIPSSPSAASPAEGDLKPLADLLDELAGDVPEPKEQADAITLREVGKPAADKSSVPIAAPVQAPVAVPLAKPH